MLECVGDDALIERSVLFKAISGERSYVGWSLTVDLIHKPDMDVLETKVNPVIVA